MAFESTLTSEKIESLVDEKKYAALRTLFEPMEAADIALLLDDMPSGRLPLLFRLLPKEQAAEVFVELGSDMQELLITSFSNTELREILEELYVDDTVDIIEEMPANVVKRILRHCDPHTRKTVNEILKYPEDSAGSLMTTEFIDLKESMTVADAFKRIRRTATDKETINVCYVTDPHRKLIGLVTIRALVLAEEEDTIAEVMDENVVSVTTMEDREEVVQAFSRYDFIALPVVDTESRLVGIITVDDALDVLEEETTEDIGKMAAITPSGRPYLKNSVWDICKSRVMWLLILMLSSTFTGIILAHFESKLSALLCLSAFIPMLMGTGGNSGSQSSVTIIRGISLREIEFSDVLRVIWKELRVSVLCGALLGVACFLKIMLIDYRVLPSLAAADAPVMVALAVSLTLAATVVLAKLVGCVLPLLADKLGFDPAVMASPFITTIVDALSLLLYFYFASLVLGI